MAATAVATAVATEPQVIIGPNPRMRAIFEYVALVGPGLGSVLVTGESGTPTSGLWDASG